VSLTAVPGAKVNFARINPEVEMMIFGVIRKGPFPRPAGSIAVTGRPARVTAEPLNYTLSRKNGGGFHSLGASLSHSVGCFLTLTRRIPALQGISSDNQAAAVPATLVLSIDWNGRNCRE
jgi:hypothetical protein